MDLPDVVGLPLPEARVRLAEAGHDEVDEVVTAPPRRPSNEGVWRVVRVRRIGERVALLVASFPTLVVAEVK